MAPVGDHREQLLRLSAERAARMAPVGDVGVELVRAGREPLVVVPSATATAVADEQRAGLEQVARGVARKLVAPGDAHAGRRRGGRHAAMPRRGERH